MEKKPGPSKAFLGTHKADVFLKLSALLTGIDDLDPVLGKEYLKQLDGKYGPAIETLCERYYSIIRAPDPLAALKTSIGADEPLWVAARQIVAIWYLSQFKDPDPNVKTPILAGHFERGLLWRVIDAHPPAFSARRHGYWAKPPQHS